MAPFIASLNSTSTLRLILPKPNDLMAFFCVCGRLIVLLICVMRTRAMLLLVNR